MEQHCEYFDRLPTEVKAKLEKLIGTGDRGWRTAFPKLSKKKKLEVGKITFGRKVDNVTMKFEHNYHTGYDIPIICAEFESE